MKKEDFCIKETRNGHHITQKTKKIWYTELNLYMEFAKFCELYNLEYHAGYGTLLGAVRHKGFIPWDDDMDFTMPRPDYQRMLQLAPEYFENPFYFQNYHSEFGASSIYNFSRLRDERTTYIAKDLHETLNDHPGIFIDIFPLDAAPSFQVMQKPNDAFGIVFDIWLATSNPKAILHELINGYIPPFGVDTLLDVLGMPFDDRLTLYENILTGLYDSYDYINFFSYISRRAPFKKEWYSHTVELPFEFLTVPAPAGYDHILRTCYGNYLNPVMYASEHEIGISDPDKPYTEYLNI